MKWNHTDSRPRKNLSGARLNHDVATNQVAYDQKVKAPKKFAAGNIAKQQKTAKRVRQASKERQHQQLSGE